METLLYYVTFFILIYFSILWVGYIIFLFGTFLAVLRKYKEADQNTIINAFNRNPLLPISIIIPAFNEENRIVNTVTGILNSDYKNVHLIVVNDGSTDGTLNLLIKKYDLKPILPVHRQFVETGEVRGYYQSTSLPNFTLIDKVHSPYENSGADCINAGMNICHTPLFLTVDADTILEPMSLSRMLFMYLTTPHCVAIGGSIYVPDVSTIKDGKIQDSIIPSNPLLGVQVCEYLRSFTYGREGWTLLGGALSFPGAFTLFETQAVREVGGFDSANFAYDAEIIMKLHHGMREKKHPYSIVFAPSAIAWSESPATLKQFWNQRSKWQRGLLRSVSAHIGMLFNPKCGITGLVAFPYYILFELFGPVVEAISYIAFILILCFSSLSTTQLAWLLLLAWSYILFITMSCVVLSILTYNKYFHKVDVLRLFLLTTLDMFFYRQFRAFCSLFATIHYCINRLRGKPE